MTHHLLVLLALAYGGMAAGAEVLRSWQDCSASSDCVVLPTYCGGAAGVHADQAAEARRHFAAQAAVVRCQQRPQIRPRARCADGRCEIWGHHFDGEVAWTVAEVAAATDPGVYVVDAWVVLTAPCRPCPRHVVCEPCLEEHVILSDHPDRPVAGILSEGQLVALLGNPGRLEIGASHRVELLVQQAPSTRELLAELRRKTRILRIEPSTQGPEIEQPAAGT